MKEGQENKKIVKDLNREVEHRNGIIESITAVNETLRTDGEKKTTTIHKCIEAIHSVKERMKMLRLENQENILKKNELEKEHERQRKLNKEKVERIEKEKRELANSNTNLVEQINEMEKDAKKRRNEEKTETTVGKREIKTLKNENDKLINSMDNMQTIIEEKSKVIVQMDNLNRRLHIHNNHLTELCLQGNQLEKKWR